MDRHQRQSRLAGVGVAGQSRLSRATVDVTGSGASAVIAARYLAGAGVAAVRVRDPVAAAAVMAVDRTVATVVDPTLPDSVLDAPAEIHDPAAREIAAGALAALASIRAIVAS